MAEWLRRQFETELEVRGTGERREVFGLLVPFERQTTIHDPMGSYDESFARGAFSKLVANPSQVGRVKLLGHHNRTTNPLGRAVELREDAAGLVGSFRVSRTQAGDEALEQVRDGSLDSFSVGFVPVVDDWNRGHTAVVRREAELREASLVTFGAYTDAVVAGMRQRHPTLSPELARQRLDLIRRKF